jgi:two-component system, NarL family, invasion response regulator UvrY
VIRVVLADDHPIVRQGLAHLLSTTSDIVVVGEARTSAEALDAGLHVPCDVLLLDLAMPGRGGFDVLRELRASRPSLRVLVLSTYDERQIAVRALRAGAAGYFTKDAPGPALLDAIRRVHAGKRAVSPELAEQLIDQIESSSVASAHERLSNRELEVLRRLADGRTVSEIGADLSLSVKTISTYRTRLLEKLGARTTGELIRFAIENRLFPR